MRKKEQGKVQTINCEDACVAEIGEQEGGDGRFLPPLHQLVWHGPQ